MSQTSNRWEVMSIREYEKNGEKKTQWTKIGVAFTNQNGSINVQLDCIPIDGKMQLQVPLTDEERQRLGLPVKGQQGQQAPQAPTQRGGSAGYSGQQQRPQGGQAQRQGGDYGQQQGRLPQPQSQQSRYRQGAAPPAYQPPPQQQAPQHGYDEAPQGSEAGWEIDGQWITDPKNLPTDHPDYIPF